MNRRSLSRVAGAIVVGAFALVSAGADDAAPAAQPVILYGDADWRAPYEGLVGTPAPELHPERWVSGEPTTLADLKGNVVLLDFWGVWCGPCVAATDEIKLLNAKYHKRGLVVIGVHTQRQKENVDAYVHKKNVKYRGFVDAGDETAHAYNVRAFPTFTLIDHEGNLRFIDIDWGREEVRGNLEHAVRVLLDERDAAMAAEEGSAGG